MVLFRKIHLNFSHQVDVDFIFDDLQVAVVLETKAVASIEGKGHYESKHQNITNYVKSLTNNSW